MELIKVQPCSHLLQRRASEQLSNEVDGLAASGSKYCIAYMDICSTFVSIVMRLASVYVNIQLAYTYYRNEQYECCRWTAICIILPMIITTLIYANMCHQDGKFSKGILAALQTLWLVFLSSFFFRYWNVLVYGIKCKLAQLQGNRTNQIIYYKSLIREESDVAFIRLFECFLESAPQKILQISIVLVQLENANGTQITAICSYFFSIAWCLAIYHRYNRYAQIDKQLINFEGLLLQLCWHFCIAVSRTLCIAFVACLFPLWTIVACLAHAFFYGFVTYINDRPRFANLAFVNFLFSLVLGIVYLFTYISVKDSTTRTKYWWYYTICALENAACVGIFLYFAAYKFGTLNYLYYILCVLALAFHYFGILFMVIYYLYFHPKITARNNKRTANTVVPGTGI